MVAITINMIATIAVIVTAIIVETTAATTDTVMAGVIAGIMAGTTIAGAGRSGATIARSAFAADLPAGAVFCRPGHTAVLPYSCFVTGWLDDSPPSTAIAWPLT